MSKINTVGIVGFGVMGAAIGINAAVSGYKVIFKELNDELVSSMYQKRVKDPLTKKVKKGKISQNEMDQIINRIIGTSNYDELSQCDLIIEAAVENLNSKIDVLRNIDEVSSKNAIIVTNTSTFLIEELMREISNPERTAGLHYFFPANVNRLVEVIRQSHTSKETFETLVNFARSNGKIAIDVKDFPGFAINPIFISSYMVLDSFYNTQYNVATLENLSKEALKLKFGIMWVQNGSGLATCYHAAVSMNSYLAASETGYPAVPYQLKDQFENEIPWNLEDGKIEQDSKLTEKLKDRLLGAIFTISTHLIEKKIISQHDLEIGICTALAWPKGPLSMMNEMGMEETSRLVHLSVENGDFKMPKTFTDTIPKKWSEVN